MESFPWSRRRKITGRSARFECANRLYKGADGQWVVRTGAEWCNAIVAEAGRSVRASVSLPSAVARRVQALAKRQRTSANRMLVELIETGLEAREQEKKMFFELADRLIRASDASEQRRIKEELARLTFGE